MKIMPLLLTDAYKLGHVFQYPEGTTEVYSNFTPRKSRLEGVNHVVFFGLQAALKQLTEIFDEQFFHQNIDDVLVEYRRVVENYVGPLQSYQHIIDLHSHGSLPIEVFAVPEGSKVPIGVPCFTIRNLTPDSFWLPNFLETILSTMIWGPTTSATIAYEYRKLLDRYANETSDNPSFVDWQGHDFSFRGMSSLESACSSGAGHLLSFTGTDTVPSLLWLEKFYNVDVSKELVAGSVSATEHSVMCAGEPDGEFDTFKRLITEVYPSGIVSVVSDTWDLWKVLTEFLPALKTEIMGRDGRLVVRPDCYDSETQIYTDSGWKFFSDLLDSDFVAQVHEDGSFDFTKPSRIINQHYEGEMCHFTDGKNKYDLLVTPNHRVVQQITRNNKSYLKIREASKVQPGVHKSDFLRGAEFKSDNSDEILTPFDRLRIAFQADGSYTTNSSNSIRFSFAKQRKIDRLLSIVNDCGFTSKVYNLSKNEKYPEHSDRVEIHVKVDADLFKKDFFWVSQHPSASYAQDFIEEVSYWDGTRRSKKRFKIDSTDLSVIEVVERMVLHAGYGSKKVSVVDDRSEKFSDVHTLHILTTPIIGGQSVSKKTVLYKGTVHCVTVPTGMILVRRKGCVAVSGNSGIPENILCGDPNGKTEAERKGVIELLWNVFGGVVNSKGFKELDSHIGAIYGDSITLERAEIICERLKNKGFASTNIVLGIGSFTYQYVTRDTFSFAIKATNVVVKGVSKAIFKDPVTDNGTKKSAKGFLHVSDDYVLTDNVSFYESCNGLLRKVFYFVPVVDDSLSDIRARVVL